MHVASWVSFYHFNGKDPYHFGMAESHASGRHPRLWKPVEAAEHHVSLPQLEVHLGVAALLAPQLDLLGLRVRGQRGVSDEFLQSRQRVTGAEVDQGSWGHLIGT